MSHTEEGKEDFLPKVLFSGHYHLLVAKPKERVKAQKLRTAYSNEEPTLT